MSQKIQITVCGGGNAAHIAAGMFNKQGADVNLFFSFEDEAKRFREGCEKNDGVTIELANETYKGKPAVITHLPEEAIPNTDYVLIITPAFAHEPILKTIKPYLKKGCFVGAIPGPGAFDLMAEHTLGKDFIKENDITIFGGSSLPWACRFEEYGARASLLGVKKSIDVTCKPDDPEKAKQLSETLTAVHRGTVVNCRGHFLTTTLWPTNCIIHTGITYGIWHDWDGKPVPEKPLFYQNCSPFTGDILFKLSSEMEAIRDALVKAIDVDLSHWQMIDVYMRDCYGAVIEDQSSVDRIFATNAAFRGLTAPVTEVEGGFMPNFNTRYLTEDLPHGLAVLRGLGEICGVATPTMDTVLTWCQEKIGHEYLVDGKIQGKDVAHSGCPQRWGITTPEGLK